MRTKKTVTIMLALVAAFILNPFSTGGRNGFAADKSGAAHTPKGDVFVPIAKYIRNGDAARLSAWFADNIEIVISGERSECSKAQARQIMKAFFEQYSPKSFSIVHKSGNIPIKYAVGTLNAGAKTFNVILLIRVHRSTAELIRIRIEQGGE